MKIKRQIKKERKKREKERTKEERKNEGKRERERKREEKERARKKEREREMLYISTSVWVLRTPYADDFSLKTKCKNNSFYITNSDLSVSGFFFQ